MRVYVACASSEVDRAERVMNELRAVSHTVTHDWTSDVREAIAAGIDEADIDDARAFEITIADANGVVTSDVLVYLAPTFTTKMAWFELGIAFDRGIRLLWPTTTHASGVSRCASELHEHVSPTRISAARLLGLSTWGGECDASIWTLTCARRADRVGQHRPLVSRARARPTEVRRDARSTRIAARRLVSREGHDGQRALDVRV